MKQIRFTPAFADDLEEIYKYISANNVRSADTLISKLQRRWRMLVDNPRIGRRRDEILLTLRSVAEGNYVIFYCPAHGDIQLMRVLHVARDVEKAFGHAHKEN